MDASIHVLQPFQSPRVPSDRRPRERGTKRFELGQGDGDAPAPGAPEPETDESRPAPQAAREDGTGEHLDVIA